MTTEACCVEEEKNITGYLQENTRLINDIEILVEEIFVNILGGDIKEVPIEERNCMLDIFKEQNVKLRMTTDKLLVIKNNLRPNSRN